MLVRETTSFSVVMMANTNTNSNTRIRTQNGNDNGPSSSSSSGTKRRRKKSRNNSGTTRKGSGSSNNNNSASSRNKNNSQPQKQQKPKKIYTLDEISKMSIAQAVVESTSTSHLINTANRLWLPSDDNLLPHLKTQPIHHEKRIKAASQLLKRWGECIGREQGVRFDNSVWIQNGDTYGDGACTSEHNNGNVNGLKRAILAASIPFDGNIPAGYVEKEIKNICIALSGIHTIAGFTLPHSSSAEDIDTSTSILDPDIIAELRSMIKRADSMASKVTMSEAVELRWAIRGILSRTGASLYPKYCDHNNGDKLDATSTCAVLKETIPNLEMRVAKLPFDIIPSCLDWKEFVSDEGIASESENEMKSLLSDIPFNFDTITTRTGAKVEERRGTAWVAAEGIGALAYSGKLMTPHALPSIVSDAMRKVEENILTNGRHEQLEICSQELGGYFDCALCNHYPDEDSACKFHTDPEHGIYWERLTCVVSAGNYDVRKFAFRPIPEVNDWNKYDAICDSNGYKYGDGTDKENNITPAVVTLFPGDVVTMDGECNDVFHHAVYPRQDSEGGTNEKLQNSTCNGRVSLVFKRAMDRGNGRKGHGKSGQGRRARRL